MLVLKIEHGDNQSSGNSLALIREIMQLERQIWRQTMTSAMKKSIELKKVPRSAPRHATPRWRGKESEYVWNTAAILTEYKKMVIMMVAMTLIAWPMKSYWICFMYMFAVTHVDT